MSDAPTHVIVSPTIHCSLGVGGSSTWLRRRNLGGTHMQTHARAHPYAGASVPQISKHSVELGVKKYFECHIDELMLGTRGSC